MPTYLITGASRGLGYAWLRVLSTDPSNTIIGLVCDRAAVAARLAADPDFPPAATTNIHLIQGDVTDPVSLQQAASAITTFFTATATPNPVAVTLPGIDILIANAAVPASPSNPSTSFLPLPSLPPPLLEADLLATFRTNVLGATNTINAFLPLIRQGKMKKVVVTSSIMSDTALARRVPQAGGYAVSKAGVNVLVGKYHAALGSAEGVLVMALCPGMVAKEGGGGGGVGAARGGGDGGGGGPGAGKGGPPPPELLEMKKGIGAALAEYAPGFDASPIPADESVRRQLAVIESATVESHGGRFVSVWGTPPGAAE